MESRYDRMSRESLIKHVKFLEAELGKHRPAEIPSSRPATKKKKKKEYDPSKYSTRLIAIKLAYLGKNYNGFEFNKCAIDMTIEGELWNALVKTHLIFPENPEQVNFMPWGYSKCGRTDRGVSAFGQVICIRVRSNQPKPKTEELDAPGEVASGDMEDSKAVHVPASPEGGEEGRQVKEPVVEMPEWDPIKDEIDYCSILNKVLPPDIRALAWCPNLPPSFNARFSCRERQYRYYFTQPAYSPVAPSITTPNEAADIRDGWLDIEAMRKATNMFEGLHDFRNFCKIDPNKQITNYWRRIFECDIVEEKDIDSALPYLEGPDLRPETLEAGPYPKVYYFHVRGSAFLWHQIRHMVAIIFAVGQRLEQPSIVSELLDIKKFPRRPAYAMAEDVPLVLWDCIFPDLSAEADTDMRKRDVAHIEHQDAMDWIWMGEDIPTNIHGAHGLAGQLWEQWRARKMDEILANRLLQFVAEKPNLSRGLRRRENPKKSSRVFIGGNLGQSIGIYQPVSRKRLLATPEELNDKFAQSLGYSNSAEMSNVKDWRAKRKESKKGGSVKPDAPQEVLLGDS